MRWSRQETGPGPDSNGIDKAAARPVAGAPGFQLADHLDSRDEPPRFWMHWPFFSHIGAAALRAT
jgi:hypothetical protein